MLQAHAQFVVIGECAGRGEQAGGLSSPSPSLQVWLAGLLVMGVVELWVLSWTQGAVLTACICGPGCTNPHALFLMDQFIIAYHHRGSTEVLLRNLSIVTSSLQDMQHVADHKGFLLEHRKDYV